MMQKFDQIEKELGLLKPSFQAKFVYSQLQNFSQHAYLLPLFNPLPSQRVGFSLEDIKIIHALSAEMILKAGQSLSIPISTTALAQLLFHFFFARLSFLTYDIRDIMMGAVYLACKQQETLRKTYQIVIVFDYIFKSYEGFQKRIHPINTESFEYKHMKNSTLIKAQLNILFQLGFEIYRLLDLPHRYIGAFLSLFERHPKFKQFSRRAWMILNNLYMTTVCLHFPSQILASAAVFIAMRETEASFPEVPWWTMMETFLESIQYIEVQLYNLRRIEKFVSLNYVSERISQVSENLHGLINVFPVPYFRKIMLEKRNKLRINKMENRIQNLDSEQKVQTEKQNNQIEEEKDEKEEQLLEKQQNEVKEVKKVGLEQIQKNLLAKVNLTLKKHEDKMREKEKEEEEEEIRILSELKKKVKLNKGRNENDKKQGDNQ